MHVFCIADCARIKKKLNSLFGSKGGGSMKRRFTLRSAVAAVLLPGSPNPDISTNLCFGWCVSGNCGVVLQAPIPGSRRSSRSDDYLLVSGAGRPAAVASAGIDTAREAALPFALFEQRFSRDGRLIAGESHDHEVVVCEIEGSCRTLTPKAQHGLTALAWSGDGTHLFFLRYTAARTSGELVSVNVEGGATKVYGSIGPFQRDFQMSMDVSPRQEVVYARYREGPHELWMAKLRSLHGSSASWNRIDKWLRRIETLQEAAQGSC